MIDKALFGISVDSKRFGTDETVSALNSISPNHTELTFLIADGLQLYNKATQYEHKKELRDILEKFRLKNDYYLEREKWLQTVKTKVKDEISQLPWEVKNIFSISDNLFHNIYRNVIIAHMALDDLRFDIKITAEEHRKKYPNSSSDYDINLSIAYIIEEIAINLRLRVVERIETEYYLGKLPEPLLNLYKNKYKVDVFTLCNIEKFDMNFEFYHSPDTETFDGWISVS